MVLSGETYLYGWEARRALKHFSSAFVPHGGQANITCWMAGEKERGWQCHLWTCVSSRLWTVDCAEGARLQTPIYPRLLSHYIWVQFYLRSPLSIHVWRTHIPLLLYRLLARTLTCAQNEILYGVYSAHLISFLQILRLIMNIFLLGKVALLCKHIADWVLLSFAVPVYLPYRRSCHWKVSLAFQCIAFAAHFFSNGKLRWWSIFLILILLIQNEVIVRAMHMDKSVIVEDKWELDLNKKKKTQQQSAADIYLVANWIHYSLD